MLIQLLVLLGLTLAIILACQKLKIPTVLGYLAVGAVLSNHTAGPVIDLDYIRPVAEFGLVFLLFTIGLSFSVSQIYALRHQILGLGTAQVGLTTLFIALGLWAFGVPGEIAFVVGAVFAQSSTTIITKQLNEQGEDQTRHGRLGTTLSVFQDVTAVPFVIVIPVLGVGLVGAQLAWDLSFAFLKAAAAFAAVFFAGKIVLMRLFSVVAQRRSAELFTVTVLFVALISAWITKSLGLSMAFGAFLAGMVLADTEFRHQVESTVRPFRDVLLGLFFVSIGMLIDPKIIPDVWLYAFAGAILMVGVKIAIVTVIVRMAGFHTESAFRTGILLSVGGEFGFALLAIALGADVIDPHVAQTLLTAVLIGMVLGAILIKFNYQIAFRLWGRSKPGQVATFDNKDVVEQLAGAEPRVLVLGFGRIGQIVSRFLESDNIAYVAVDKDPIRAREARLAGQPVFYGESSDPAVLEMMGVERAGMVLICHDDTPSALKSLAHIRQVNESCTVLVRTRDDTHVQELLRSGATEVIPETVETGMLIVSHALRALGVPLRKVARHIEEQRMSHFSLLQELLRDSADDILTTKIDESDRIHPVVVNEGSPMVGQTLEALSGFGRNVRVTALVRARVRTNSPEPNELVQAGDTLVICGKPDDIAHVEAMIGP